MIFAVAASVLIMVGLATWVMLRQRTQQTARIVVDLRDRSMSRGTEPPPSEPPIEIARNVAHLDIYLPLGSSDGSYDIRIASVSGESFVSATGEAKLEQGVTVLVVDLGTRLPTSGRYLMQIRRHDAQWVSFPLRIR